MCTVNKSSPSNSGEPRKTNEERTKKETATTDVEIKTNTAMPEEVLDINTNDVKKTEHSHKSDIDDKKEKAKDRKSRKEKFDEDKYHNKKEKHHDEESSKV